MLENKVPSPIPTVEERDMFFELEEEEDLPELGVLDELENEDEGLFVLPEEEEIMAATGIEEEDIPEFLLDPDMDIEEKMRQLVYHQVLVHMGLMYYHRQVYIERGEEIPEYHLSPEHTEFFSSRGYDVTSFLQGTKDQVAADFPILANPLTYVIPQLLYLL